MSKSRRGQLFLLFLPVLILACVDERSGQHLDRNRSIHRIIPSEEIGTLGRTQERANQAYNQILDAEKSLASIGLRVHSTLVVDDKNQIQGLRFSWDEQYLIEQTQDSPSTTLAESILLLEDFSLALDNYIRNFLPTIPFVEKGVEEDFVLDAHFEDILRGQKKLVDEMLKDLREKRDAELSS